MLTERQTEPGLVAFYDIWPGNRVGLFLQPWNLHGATSFSATIFNTAKRCQSWVTCPDLFIFV